MDTPFTLKRKNSPFCASQCVWQLWMKAPFPAFPYVGPLVEMVVSKSVMYLREEKRRKPVLETMFFGMVLVQVYFFSNKKTVLYDRRAVRGGCIRIIGCLIG
jgi:hypothetical protein